MIRRTASYHAILQGYLDCLLEANPRETLQAWADRGWALDKDVEFDEECMKYIALVIIDSLAHKAHKLLLEMGCPALVAAPDASYMLPAAPESLLSRGLEMLRDICGMTGAKASGSIALGIGNDLIELKIERNKGLHVLVFGG